MAQKSLSTCRDRESSCEFENCSYRTGEIVVANCPRRSTLQWTTQQLHMSERFACHWPSQTGRATGLKIRRAQAAISARHVPPRRPESLSGLRGGLSYSEPRSGVSYLANCGVLSERGVNLDRGGPHHLVLGALLARSGGVEPARELVHRVDVEARSAGDRQEVVCILLTD